MDQVTVLEPYADDRGNEIRYVGPARAQNIRVSFHGRNNKLIVASDARIGRLVAEFDCDNGVVTLGSSARTRGSMSFSLRVGEDCSITVGDNTTTTNPCGMTTAEGTSIVIGDDCMIATDNEIRADDGHPIFDIRSGKRANPSRSITIGDHVWLAKRAVVLGGAVIGNGSVVGFGSIVKGRVPNNAIAAGVPARVVRRDIAWERPHLSMATPRYKLDQSDVEHSPYWSLTEAELEEVPRKSPSRRLGWRRKP